MLRFLFIAFLLLLKMWSDVVSVSCLGVRVLVMYKLVQFGGNKYTILVHIPKIYPAKKKRIRGGIKKFVH